MVVMLILLLILHGWLYYCREIRFYSQPYFNGLKDPRRIYSPVEGTVVYSYMVSNTKETRESPVRMNKSGRLVDIPWNRLVEGETYLMVGIFMTPYNNHHMLHPLTISHRMDYEDVGDDLLPMMSKYDSLLPFRTFKNWYKKHLDDFIAYNKRRVFWLVNHKCPLVMCMILDKYVSKISLTPDKKVNDRSVLGFVSRGSQMDVFIPIKYASIVSFYEGKKVTFDTVLAVIK